MYDFLSIHVVTLLELEQTDIKVKKTTWLNKDKSSENIYRWEKRENEEIITDINVDKLVGMIV